MSCHKKYFGWKHFLHASNNSVGITSDGVVLLIPPQALSEMTAAFQHISVTERSHIFVWTANVLIPITPAKIASQFVAVWAQSAKEDYSRAASAKTKQTVNNITSLNVKEKETKLGCLEVRGHLFFELEIHLEVKSLHDSHDC